MKKTYTEPAVRVIIINDEALLCASDKIGFTSTKGDNTEAVLSRERSGFSFDEDEE